MARHLKPVGGFELGAWYFMRISGLLLVFLALGHLLITHILHNVEDVNYKFVAERWGDPRVGVVWRLWDLTMINLAVLHGCNGLRQVLDEYVVRRNRRVLVHTLIWCSAIFLMTIGTYAILLFQADQKYLDTKYAPGGVLVGHPAAAGDRPEAPAAGAQRGGLAALGAIPAP